jgi:predicted DNA-binding transcriptional regulator YafY
MAKKEGSVSQKKLQRVLQIHRLLRTRRSFTGKELEEACREVDPEVTTRTVASDIAFLREVLHAPIAEKSNRWTNYAYEEDYSIFEGLDDSFTGALEEVLAVIRQLSRKKEFQGLEDLLLRLEQRASMVKAEKNDLILFEEPELKGRQYLLPLYRAMLSGHTLNLTYEPFAKAPESFCIRPCLLKEFNNRWYLFAWRQGTEIIQNYPLDRIVAMERTSQVLPQRPFQAKAHFQRILGVTNDTRKPDAIPVRLRFKPNRGKYVITKKIHPDQKEQIEESGYVVVSFLVQHNQELETKILEFGADVEVLGPEELRQSIKECLQSAVKQYNLSDLSQ